jgi:release factor glutamine methyltransferase
MRLRDLVDGARRRFEAAGIPKPEATLDAELLARDVLGWDRATWLVRRDDDEHSVDDRTVSTRGLGAFSASFESLVTRRLRREPIAYIRGTQEFYGREFLVGPGVLIPRPETELLIDAVRAVAAGRPAPRIADIGTGSGCIAVTLALELPGARLVATDVSAEALVIARGNAAAHDVFRRITFAETSYLTGVKGTFDVVASNPPYVSESDGRGLQPEVRDFEPARALYGGADGLRDIRMIVAEAPRSLVPGGALVVEVGMGQAESVLSIAAEAGLADAVIRHDLQGIPRVVVAYRSQ